MARPARLSMAAIPDTPVPASVATFLETPTPDAWVQAAIDRLPELLTDHANCELKAASTALGLIYRYPTRGALCDRMSRLAREELRHFEQVRKLMARRGIPFRKLSASRYAGALRERQRPDEPGRLIDSLLIGAIIEARSCERFAVLVPRLSGELQRFYAGLLTSEARHFENYLALAVAEAGECAATVETRLDELKAFESGLISSPDDQLRFHSGLPARSQAFRIARDESGP